uniref:Diacylglycerol lipase-alpha n=1 Tax=Sinocyclocheilus grahami TaxID=75366 RepID=A0A672QRF9_SINGR
MPGMVLFRRRWSVGSDDLVLPAFFLFILHCIWLVVLSVVLFGLPYSSEQSCSVTLVDHGRGYLGILVSCLICESAIMWLSMRGSILYTQPREAVQYMYTVHLNLLFYFIYSFMYLFSTGIVVCNWLVIFSVCFTMMCTFDPTGRTFVKLKATRRRQRNLTTYTLRHRLEEGQASSWSRRLKFFMCCTRAKDTQSDAYSEVASLFAEFFRDLDIVPSDIIAGLVLLRQRQRAKRAAILDQANNDVLAFLSGIPVTRNTKYLDLKNSSEMAMYKEVCYYMLFAMAAYGWPVYLLRQPACGLCRLVSTCSYVKKTLDRSAKGSITVEEDNCCGCNVLAIRRQFLDQDLKEVQIVYTSCHDAVYETPFFVAVDHVKKKVVISIRGTLSPKDALTDLTGDSERLPLEEQHGTWLGHKGMVYSAEYIKKKLEQEMILSQAFGRDLGKGTMHYELVIVGHSLGAGTAAILSFLLRPQYPSLHCYSYSPPGGLLSEDAMEYSKEFVTSVVLGKDLVPRIGLSQLEGFRRHLLEVLQKSDKPKWRIIAGGTKCIPKSELPLDDEAPVSQGVTPSNSRLWLHPSDLSIALSASTPLYPPGRVIHVVHNHPPEMCCGQEDPTYSALWGDNKAFDEVIISPAMLNEHLPHVVMDGLNKVCACVCVCAFVCTLFCLTLAKCNVSDWISLDGFSECPPPPVPVVLTGARERLAVELRERKAPLAIMESLSDAESVYSLDSRRSSAALRENPSLSSRTELLAADGLDRQPASQGKNSRRSSGTPVACQPSAIPNSQESCPVASRTGSMPETPKDREFEEGEVESVRSETLPPVPPLSNGTPSQAVLEFAQYLDSLFRLDGSSSPPLELSDAESESGRGSYSQAEGQNADKDRQLLARATLEPNLVPKPPRTFAGSADPSSGISLSPSFPLSSSGELNDFSPPDGVLPPNHTSALRTSAASPNPKETVLPSMV